MDLSTAVLKGRARACSVRSRSTCSSVKGTTLLAEDTFDLNPGWEVYPGAAGQSTSFIRAGPGLQARKYRVPVSRWTL